MEDVKLKEKIREFLSADTGSGYGSGDGDGCGSGSGDGCGSGCGSGSGDGCGSGSGYGYGDGCGSGSGDGYGSGDGSGYGSGLDILNGQKIYLIDYTQTIITFVHGNIAKGFILHSDLMLTQCYIVKGNNQFAHGYTLREAMTALTDKMFDSMTEDERICEFVKTHPDPEKAYPNQDLFDWHHRLTGSCLAGRNAFIKDHGLNLDDKTTVTEFIRMTENTYNGFIIRKLKEQYK